MSLSTAVFRNVVRGTAAYVLGWGLANVLSLLSQFALIILLGGHFGTAFSDVTPVHRGLILLVTAIAFGLGGYVCLRMAGEFSSLIMQLFAATELVAGIVGVVQAEADVVPVWYLGVLTFVKLAAVEAVALPSLLDPSLTPMADKSVTNKEES